MESKKINQLATNVSPQTSDLTIIGDPITGVSKKITLLQIANLFSTVGTVTSVGITETGNALTITGSPITSAGTINIGFAGAATQYVRGDGALADFPTSTGGGSSVSYYLNSSVSQGTIGGVDYRELSKDPIAGAGTDITISANGYVASFLTDANDPSLLEVPAGNFNCELYFSVNSNNHNPYVYAEVYKYDGSTFTLIGSSQSVPEYLTNGTTLSPYYFAIPVTQTTLAITDRIAIRIYVNVDTKVVTLHTENNHLCQVITTFSKGLTSLNNLTRQVQFLATGTSGTDFNISSSTATHTFNIPVASATNTGKLSSTDWSTFNGKQPALSGTGFVKISGTTISYDNSTYLTTSSAASTYVPYTGATANLNMGSFDILLRDLAVNNVQPNGDNVYDIGISGGFNFRNVYAYSFVKKGGTSSQFLKADGSVDSSTYLTTSSAASTYLPLAGGTLTGTLNGTSAVFSSTMQASAYRLSGMTAGSGALYWTSDRVTLANYNATGVVHIEANGGAGVATFGGSTFNNDFVGTGRFTGALTGTSANFSSNVAIGGATSPPTAGLKVAGDIISENGIGVSNVEGGVAANYYTTYSGGGTPLGFLYGSGGVVWSNGGTKMSLTSAGALQLVGGLSATTGTFSGNLTIDTDTLFVDSTNNKVGIGTTSPYTKFQVNGGNASILSSSTAATDGTGDVRNAGFAFKHASADLISALINTTAVADWGLNLHFNTRQFNAVMPATPAMTITSGQNVGIGTSTDAGYKLDVRSTASSGAPLLANFQSAGGDPQLYVSNGTITTQLTADNTNSVSIVGSLSNHPLVIRTNNTERMRITSGGFLKASNTGIYNNASIGYHELRSNASDEWTVYISNTSASPYGIRLQYPNASPNNGTNSFIYADDSTALRFEVRSNGGIENYQANNVNLSDERTKKDIIPLESYWDKFKAIEIVKFKYKDQTHDDFNIGVIAQQVESVAPEFVDTDMWTLEDEQVERKAIYTSDLHHATIKVLQECMTKIEEQQAQIEELRTLINK
jgi:hypothetical protein